MELETIRHGGSKSSNSRSSSSSSFGDASNNGNVLHLVQNMGQQVEISFPASITFSSPFRHQHCLVQAFYHLKDNWKILAFGQVLSLLLASGGAAQATLHLDCGLSAPTFTMTMTYFGLSLNIFLLLWRIHRTKSHSVESEETGRIINNTTDKDQIERETISNSDLTLSEGNEYTDNQDEMIDEFPSNDAATLSHQYTYCYRLLRLRRPLWWYILVAFLDVEANSITMLAFRYTTLTSVTLFDALAIPSSMFISRCWLGRKYRRMHYLGVIVCMVGVIANMMSDYESDVNTDNESEQEKREYPYKLQGDICAITGGILYGLNDVLTEVTVSDTQDNTEYLAMMGIFAFCISLVQSLLLEWNDILEFFGEDTSHSSTCSLQEGWWLFFTFVGVTMLSYAGASRFLIISEAAFFNLSLLTGDLWSVIFSIVAERIVPKLLFFVALLFVLSGVVIYEMAPSPATEKKMNESSSNVNANDGVVRSMSEHLPSPSRLISLENDKQSGIELCGKQLT